MIEADNQDETLPRRIARDLMPSAAELWTLFGAVAVAGVLTAAVLAQPFVEPVTLFRDPAAVTVSLLEQRGISGIHIGAYFGLFSNVGAILWITAAPLLLTIAYFGWTTGDRALAFGALLGAGLTVFLVLDDLLMIHEVAERRFSGAQTLILSAQAAATLAYLLGFVRRVAGRVSPLLFLGALACFFFSVAVDKVLPTLSYGTMVMVEDMPKFLGILLWTAYHFSLATTLLAPRPMDDLGP